MLHEILEKIPFDSLRAAPSLERLGQARDGREGL